MYDLLYTDKSKQGLALGLLLGSKINTALELSSLTTLSWTADVYFHILIGLRHFFIRDNEIV